MDDAVVSLVSTVLVLTGVMGMVLGSCSSADLVSESWEQMTGQATEMARTRITREGIQDGALVVRLTLKNIGQTALGDFPRWDVIVQYYAEQFQPYVIRRLAYTDGLPGDNEWTVEGIFKDAQTGTPEVFDPGILSPGEEVRIRLTLVPSAGLATRNWAIVTTANGISTELMFTIFKGLYVVDVADDAVYEYREEDGAFISSYPLDSQNADARGITTDDANFWTTDIKDDEVYKYSLSLSLETSWPQTAANKDGEGITTDGSNIWVIDKRDDIVYKYDMSGTFISSFRLTRANRDATGIATDGKNIWVVDIKDDRVYKYDMNGRFISSFNLTPENKDATGITTDGTNIWVVDIKDDRVYKYDMNGRFISSFSLIAANGDPQGITVGPRG